MECDKVFAENCIIFTYISVFCAKANSWGKVGQVCRMFFCTWRTGVDTDFQIGQFTSMGEDVMDILLCLKDAF